MIKYDKFVESLNLLDNHKSGKHYTFEECKNKTFKTVPRKLENVIQFKIKWFYSLYYGEEARERVLTNIFLRGGYYWDNSGIKSSRDKYTDDKMMKYRLSRREQKEKEYLENIELSKKFIDILRQEQNDNEDNSVIKHIEKLKERITKLTNQIQNFDPFFISPFNDVEQLIDRIPDNISLQQIHEIPDNAKPDYIQGFKEILSFYSQKKFKNDTNYNSILEMKDELNKKF